MKTIILFITLWTTNISSEQLDAIRNYKEFGTKCVPQRLKDLPINVNYKDSTYIMQPDLNGILWVTEKATTN